MRYPKTRSALLPALGAAGLAFLLAACGVDSSLDRGTRIVRGIRIDSLKFLPAGSRYILLDSATRILMRKFHPGYACSEILQLDLESIASGEPPAFQPVSAVRLPAEDCALDSTGRDTTVAHVFGKDAGLVRVANSSDQVTGSAEAVRGEMAFDSLVFKFDSTRVFSRGTIIVKDTGSGSASARTLYADSLGPCQYLNQADEKASGDTLKIRLSIVTLDATTSPKPCDGPVHPDSVPVVAHLP